MSTTACGVAKTATSSTYAWGKNEPITFTYPVRMTDTGYVEYNRYEDVWVELGRIDLLESMFLDLARRFWDRQDTRSSP